VRGDGSGRGSRVREAAIIALISVALFVPLAEVVLRARCTYCSWSEANLGRLANPYELPPTPHLLRAKNKVFSDGQVEFDYPVRTNSLGFRDEEHPVAKAPGEVRILAIGDSFTEGQGAPFEATWLRLIGARLAAANPERKIRMICGGVAGSDPVYGYRVLVDLLLRFGPDLVVLVINHSDVMDVLVRGGMERYRPDGTVRSQEVPRFRWRVYKTSHLARSILFEAFDYTHYLITKSERHRRAEAALHKIDALISEFEALLSARGIAFALVVHPLKNEFRRDRYDWMHELRDSASARGIAVVDANPHLQEVRVRAGLEWTDLYWPLDEHFTPTGYRHFADAVMEGLCPSFVERGLRCADRGGD